jgi:hypothetical protein
MNRLNKPKLNFLLRQWPVGVLLTSNWLKEHGYYKQLVKLYSDKGWIKSVGNGAYARLNDKVSWQGAVKAIQSQLNMPIHVGGLTALQSYGISQYMMLDNSNPVFYLYNTTITKFTLPSWFQQYFTNCHLEQKKLFENQTGVSKKEIDGVELSVSAPERAILEVLALVPNKLTLSHANELIEGMDRLRSNVVQQLLEHCHSIKVKRLFLYLAEKNNLSCFKELNLDRLNLGSGKRVIGKGGVYSAKWMLSVPPLDEMNNQLENDGE